MIYENESCPLYISEEGYKTTGDFAVYTLHDWFRANIVCWNYAAYNKINELKTEIMIWN